MAPIFKVGDRVRCLASRFNEAEPDRNGQYFADRHRAQGNGEYCFGTIKWVYSQRGRNPQCYRVLYDGDSTQLRSAEAHLEPEGDEDRLENFDHVAEEGQWEEAGDIEIDDHPDDEGSDREDISEGDGEPTPMGMGGWECCSGRLHLGSS